MIGQEVTLNNLNKLPRFTIITGIKGQGKKTLARQIARKFDYMYAPIGIKIDDIRYMIETAYKQTEPIVYIIPDADDMSLGAKNSLLKVIEEPPQNAYFIMTLEQIENTLDTIKSRCYEIKMQHYTHNEKMEMIKELLPNATQDEITILSKLDNFYQMQKIIEYGVVDFYDFVKKVYNNIYKVQSANSFKLEEKLDLKNDGNGYDLELFFIIYNYCVFEDLTLNDLYHPFNVKECLYNCLGITKGYKNLLTIKGINRQMLIDNWILDIRKEWLAL